MYNHISPRKKRIYYLTLKKNIYEKNKLTFHVAQLICKRNSLQLLFFLLETHPKLTTALKQKRRYFLLDGLTLKRFYFSQRFHTHTQLWLTNTINERRVHTCTHRICDCTNTTIISLDSFLNDSNVTHTQAQTTSNPFSQCFRIPCIKFSSLFSFNLV